MPRSSTDRTRPKEGRCNAKTAGGYCHANRIKGAHRCRIHGGHAIRFGERWKKLSVDAQAELDEAVEDPELMEARRPIAMLQVIAQNTELLPKEETVARYARRMNLRGLDPMTVTALQAAAEKAAKNGETTGSEKLAELLELLLEPDDADLEVARTELHDRSMRMVSTLSRRQNEALKALEWTKVVREVALPIIGEFGLAVTGVLRKYVPEESRDEATNAVHTAMAKVIGELAQVGEATS